MIIFVPTRGRVNKQTSWEYGFLDDMPWRVVRVVPECEKHHWTGDVGVVPDSYRVSDIQQWITETYASVDPFHAVVDDDLYFFRRIVPTEPPLRKADVKDVVSMFRTIETYLQDGYVHGAISAREGNNRVETANKENTRAMRLVFRDASVILGEGLRFTDVMVRNDFHMTLSLLELGYPNIVDFEFAHNQCGSASVGGTSWYRTRDMMASEAYRLAELHPGFVKVVEKETATAWGGGTRVDVQMSWQKAFGSREKERKLFR